MFIILISAKREHSFESTVFEEIRAFLKSEITIFGSECFGYSLFRIRLRKTQTQSLVKYDFFI